jgi:hypothetical protein
VIGWSRKTKKKANEAVKARKNAMVADDIDSEVCEGDVQLEITPFESFSQINKFTKYLATIKNISVVSESWSEDEGFNIVISVRAPLALGRVLQDMPELTRVQLDSKKTSRNDQKYAYKKMVVVMKTAESPPEPLPE